MTEAVNCAKAYRTDEQEARSLIIGEIDRLLDQFERRTPSAGIDEVQKLAGLTAAASMLGLWTIEVGESYGDRIALAINKWARLRKAEDVK